jgi:hypothetical protein
MEGKDEVRTRVTPSDDSTVKYHGLLTMRIKTEDQFG